MPSNTPVKIKDWIEQNVTRNASALAWFDAEECEPRIVKAYRELLSGYNTDPSTILKTTRKVESPHKGVVVIRDINFYSLCAHHFLPFFGTVNIWYQPGAKILGLGKFPRLVDAYGRRFQIQEDLVKEIAEEVLASGGALGVLVRSRARHLCMCSRGPGDDTVLTDTSYECGDTRLIYRAFGDEPPAS
jgi:GTP cyclohydrolase I